MKNVAKATSKHEDLLAFQLRAAKIRFWAQFQPFEGRKFAFDFLCSRTDTFKNQILVEVQGGIWRKGAHSSGTGITRDCEKAALAAVHGYRLIPVTPAHIKSGQALQWIEAALGIKPLDK